MTKADERRARENAAVLARMKDGHNLCHTDLSAYRWAPRQQLKKDQKEMDRLYGIERRPAVSLAEEE